MSLLVLNLVVNFYSSCFHIADSWDLLRDIFQAAKILFISQHLHHFVGPSAMSTTFPSRVRSRWNVTLYDPTNTKSLIVSLTWISSYPGTTFLTQHWSYPPCLCVSSASLSKLMVGQLLVFTTCKLIVTWFIYQLLKWWLACCHPSELLR